MEMMGRPLRLALAARVKPDKAEMPIAYRYEPEISAVSLTVFGVVAWPERHIMVRVAEFLLSELKIKNVLLDCSRLSKNGNVDDAVEFAKRVQTKKEIFRGLRIAVLPAEDFYYLPWMAILGIQDAGIEVVECQSEAEASAWLAESDNAAEKKAESAA